MVELLSHTSYIHNRSLLEDTSITLNKGSKLRIKIRIGAWRNGTSDKAFVLYTGHIGLIPSTASL